MPVRCYGQVGIRIRYVQLSMRQFGGIYVIESRTKGRSDLHIGWTKVYLSTTQDGSKTKKKMETLLAFEIYKKLCPCVATDRVGISIGYVEQLFTEGQFDLYTRRTKIPFVNDTGQTKPKNSGENPYFTYRYRHRYIEQIIYSSGKQNYLY